MANAFYAKGKEHLLGGDVALDTDDIRAILVDAADYTVNLTTHDALDDIPAGARVAVAALASKTVTDGVFDAADLTFAAVSGDPCEAVVFYKHTGVESTSWLVCYLDTMLGLPVTPNGGDIVIQWAAGPYNIFAI